MPWKARRKCIEPNCSEYAIKGDCRCLAHKRQHDERYRRSEDRQERANLYGSSRWQALRAAVLRERPFCARCLERGEYTIATVVDHIKPHKGDSELFFDVKNLQPLCKVCHDIKTATEDGGFGHDQRVRTRNQESKPDDSREIKSAGPVGVGGSDFCRF